MTKEAAALIREEIKVDIKDDCLGEYLRTLDHEIDSIDKRVRLMMSNVKEHSQQIRDNTNQEKKRDKRRFISSSIRIIKAAQGNCHII